MLTRGLLSQALEKKAKAEKLLSELEKSEMSKQPEIDKEGVTEEERYMLRKIGLKMKPFLLMGEFFSRKHCCVYLYILSFRLKGF